MVSEPAERLLLGVVNPLVWLTRGVGLLTPMVCLTLGIPVTWRLLARVPEFSVACVW